MARKIRKPVYMVDETKEIEIPSWIQGCATRIFKSMEELQKFLIEEYDGDSADLSNELIN